MFDNIVCQLLFFKLATSGVSLADSCMLPPALKNPLAVFASAKVNVTVCVIVPFHAVLRVPVAYVSSVAWPAGGAINLLESITLT